MSSGSINMAAGIGISVSASCRPESISPVQHRDHDEDFDVAQGALLITAHDFWLKIKITESINFYLKYF